MSKQGKRIRIAKKPLRVFSTTKKYVGIVAKYALEKEISMMRMSQHESKNRSAANIMHLVQRDWQAQQLQLV
jgi:hypothetical protein